MRVSALDRILATERVGRRTTSTHHGGFAHPVLHERSVTLDEGPFVVSNKRGSFVQTRRRQDGTIWAGFSDVPVGGEGTFLRELYLSLWRISVESAWHNRCSALSEASPVMTSLGFSPRCVIVPHDLLTEACGNDLTAQDADRLMLAQGYVAKVGEAFVLAGDLPAGAALVTTMPSVVGTYTRTDQSLAVMLFRADRAVVLVGEGLPHGVA